MAELEDLAREVCRAQERVIRAVTPGHPRFLYSQGPKVKDHPDHPERYAALFSAWHAATRALAEHLGEPKR